MTQPAGKPGPKPKDETESTHPKDQPQPQQPKGGRDGQVRTLAGNLASAAVYAGAFQSTQPNPEALGKYALAVARTIIDYGDD